MRNFYKYNLGRILWKKDRKQAKSPHLPPTPQQVQPRSKNEITREEWLDKFGKKEVEKV